MTTYGELQDKVSRAIQDPDGATFDTQAVEDMIAAAWADISREAPRRFQEDITPVADTLVYDVLADDFPEGNDDIEPVSVEVWDGTTTPPTPYRKVTAQIEHPSGLSYSQAGWRFWGGQLYIPNSVEAYLVPETHLIRIWGYSPWPLPDAEDDVIPLTAIAEEALVIRTHIEALRRLIGNRVLFTQWQTRSNNTDVTPAYLMNEKAQAEQEWSRLLRAIRVTREQP